VFTERERGKEGGRKASGKAGASFKSADEELLPGILLSRPTSSANTYQDSQLSGAFFNVHLLSRLFEKLAFPARNKHRRVLCVEDKR